MDAHGNVLITYWGAIRSVGDRGHAEWIQGPVSSTAEHFGYARCVLLRANANYGPNYLSSISIRAQ